MVARESASSDLKMAMFFKVLSRALGPILLLVAISIALPALGSVAVYGWILIGDYTGWYRGENYISSSDH
jgi:hypothetical protein